MNVPLHGKHCRTHTFPTTCNRCGDEVFFFSCTCGSKVFFDQLGWPWLEHDCAFSQSDQKWADGKTKTSHADGSVKVEISDGITAIRPAERRVKSWNIDPKIVEIAKREGLSRESHPIQSVPPGSDWEVDIVGVVRELIPCIDVYQRLGLPHTSLSKGFLGDLGSGTWSRVTIHELKSITYSYTAWVMDSRILEYELKPRLTIRAKLERFDIPKKAREWICRDFQIQ